MKFKLFKIDNILIVKGKDKIKNCLVEVSVSGLFLNMVILFWYGVFFDIDGEKSIFLVF